MNAITPHVEETACMNTAEQPLRLRKNGTAASPNWGGSRPNTGGARDNAGGARSGAGGFRIAGPGKKVGRPRKIPSSSVPTRYPEMREHVAAVVKPYKVKLRHDPALGNITTSGSLRDFTKAWVYVADCGGGIMKVGMSSDLQKRMRDLGAKLVSAVPVNPAHAKTVETLALRHLGGQKSGTEFICCKPERAALAVRVAVEELRKVCRVDPPARATS